MAAPTSMEHDSALCSRSNCGSSAIFSIRLFICLRKVGGASGADDKPPPSRGNGRRHIHPPLPLIGPSKAIASFLVLPSPPPLLLKELPPCRLQSAFPMYINPNSDPQLSVLPTGALCLTSQTASRRHCAEPMGAAGLTHRCTPAPHTVSPTPSPPPRRIDPSVWPLGGSSADRWPDVPPA